MCFKTFLGEDKGLNGLQDSFADVDFIHVDTSKMFMICIPATTGIPLLIKGREATAFLEVFVNSKM